MVSLVSFNANASPPGYDDIGINPIPVMQIDNATITDVQVITPLATLEIRFFEPVYNIANVIQFVPNDTGTDNTVFNVYTDIGKHSNSQVLFYKQIINNSNGILIESKQTITTLTIYGYHLLCYTSDMNDNKRILKRKTHSRYRQVLSYTNTGYGLWS